MLILRSFNSTMLEKHIIGRNARNSTFLILRKCFRRFVVYLQRWNLYNFSEAKTFEYIEKAKKYTGLNFEKADFLHDLYSVPYACLLRDGLDITFSHRSFQEYFTAVFTSQMDNIENFNRKYMRKLFFRPWILYMTKTVPLLFEIYQEIRLKNIWLPRLEELREDYGAYENCLTPEAYNKFAENFLPYFNNRTCKFHSRAIWCLCSKCWQYRATEVYDDTTTFPGFCSII